MKRKKRVINASNLTADELIARVGSCKIKFSHKVCVLVGLLLAIVVPLSYMFLSVEEMSLLEDGDSNVLSLASVPIAATSVKKDLISIPSGTVKANPFLPYRELSEKVVEVDDVPKFDLVAPPELVSGSSEAVRVMDTVVSGILFDKYSPSAILNIEGNDYLVKKGDVVNSYKVLDICQNSVTVKLGNNTYNAGIGEILTEGSINHNDVSNLSKKFGGERDEK